MDMQPIKVEELRLVDLRKARNDLSRAVGHADVLTCAISIAECESGFLRGPQGHLYKSSFSAWDAFSYGNALGCF